MTSHADTPVDPPADQLAEPIPVDRPPRVLVLDDQPPIRSLFVEVLSQNGYEVVPVETTREAEEELRRGSFDAVFIDIFINPTESGLVLLPLIKELQPNTPAIVISGVASMDDVVEALKAGAYDMLCKPFNILDLTNVAARAVEKKRMADERDRLLVALRHERDLLEERVNEATKDLQTTIGTLRLLNEQVSTMFEISQTLMAEGSLEDVMRRIFELLRRMFDFSGAFCVIYDARAHGINLTYSQGENVDELCMNMTHLFHHEGGVLVDVAEAEERLPVAKLQKLIWQLYPAPLPSTEVILVPVHVHQTLLGVVGLNCTDRKGAHLTPEDERMLGLAISQLLTALEQRNFIARTGQLASLGELISEIAHDLRHPMTALRGASRMLMDGWNQEEKRERCLTQIKSNLGRMESLVSELVNFYNPKELNMVSLDLHGLLDKAIEVSSAVLGSKSIEVVRHYEQGDPQILGLTRNLIEAFINLITNACQAMQEGGRLTITTTTRLDESQRERLRERNLLASNYLMVAVADTGCGIPPENRDRVFRRFFTTKEDGTGLGLAAVQRLVRKNLGHIDFESSVGVGTTFYVYLPKA